MDDALIAEGFHGPGGWAEGRRLLGMTHRSVGLELDEAACRTAKAAGHTVICCDVTQYPTAPFAGRTWGKVDSPPCPTFSRSGNRAGAHDMPLVLQAIDDLSRGRDTRGVLRAACCDERSILTAEPLRWHYDLRPEWIAMEQVPAVLPIWQAYAEILRSWGYSVDVRVLNAADYGLPQQRRRAVLAASRVRAVSLPLPTHGGIGQPPLVPMAEAVGWGYTRRPAPTVTGGGVYTGGAEPFGNGTRRAMRAAMERPGEWAPKPGGGTKPSVAECAVLQGFRPDYPFYGRMGQQHLQVGNAVPPPLAAVALSAASGVPLREELEAAA